MSEQLSNIEFVGGAKIKNLPAATLAGEAVNFEQLASALEGLKFKANVKAYAASNINIASPGAAISGTTMAVNDAVLVANQTAPSENGIYIWNGAAVPLTRRADANTATELTQAVVTVGADSVSNPGTTWRQSATITTINTDPVTFASFGVVAPAASDTTPGIIEIATQGEVDAGVDALRAVTPATLAAWSGRKLKLTGVFGDGAATSYAITHNFGTRAVTVEVYRNSGNYDKIGCDVEHGTNAVTLKGFVTAPSSNQFVVVVLG